MSAKKMVIFSLCCALAAQAAQAAPILTVTPGGIAAGTRKWFVSITPDASLFTNSGPSGAPPNTVGGSLATEIGFTVGPGTLVSANKNATNFPSDNPGLSPFSPPINGVQFGVVTSGNNIFAALGSDFFSSATPQQMLTITTAGTGPTSITWLGAYSGKGRIGQGPQNFDLYSGTVSVPEPATCILAAIGFVAVLWAGRRSRVG